MSSADRAKEAVKILAKSGCFYRVTDNRLYYHYKIAARNEVFPLQADNQRLRSLLTAMGVNAATVAYKYVVESLRAEADLNGQVVEVHRVSHRVGNAIYVDMGWDGNKSSGAMWCITTDGVNLVPIGTDGVLFETSPRDELRLLKSPPSCRCGDKPGLQFPSRLQELVPLPNFGGGRLTYDQGMQALVVWVYNLFFAFSTNPILIFLGERASGKSWLARVITKLYMGMQYGLIGGDGDHKDLAAALTNDPLVGIDNWDSVDRHKFDLTARTATGGSEARRTYFTTNSRSDFPLIARLLITQRNAALHRDDLADRLVVLRCLPLRKSIRPEGELGESLEKAHPELLRALFHDLTHILGEWDNAHQGWKTSFRMADYALLGHIVARIEGKEQEWETTLNVLKSEQEEYLGRDNPLADAIAEYLGTVHGRFEGTAGELHKTVKDMEPSIAREYASPTSLAKELPRIKQALEHRGITLNVREDRHSRQKVYCLEMNVDANVAAEQKPLWASGGENETQGERPAEADSGLLVESLVD